MLPSRTVGTEGTEAPGCYDISFSRLAPQCHTVFQLGNGLEMSERVGGSRTIKSGWGLAMGNPEG